MSIFLSFNFKTGEKIAIGVEQALRKRGLDAWWFPEPVSPQQLDSMVSLALGNCDRCIVLLTNDPVSGWQMAEITSIRQVFSSRMPSGMGHECFVFLRATNLVPSHDPLPMFQDSQYVDFSSDDISALDLSFLDSPPPGMVPITCGPNRKPRILRKSSTKMARGRHILYGDFDAYEGEPSERNCWIFLKDVYGQFYIQQPRPTITHRDRWAAPNIVLGSEIAEILLTAADDATHRKIVNLVLSESFGAIKDQDLIGSLDILDRVSFDPT